MADDAAPEKRPRGWNLRGQKHPDSGRKKGTPNKVTREMKAIVEELIDENADNLREWIRQVAQGVPAEYETDPETNEKRLIRAAIPGDPAKAADLLFVKMAEYAAPKLARSEITGAGGKPLIPPAVGLYIEDKPPDDDQSA